MKKLLSILVLLILPFLSIRGMAQYADRDRYRGGLAFQLGGQFSYSVHYEFAFLRKEYFTLATSFGYGRNDFIGSRTEEKPIRGIDLGLTTLSGKNRLYFEAGLHPATYLFGHNTFVNVNGWFGLRFFPKKAPAFGLSLAYTPRLYTSFSDPTHHFFNCAVGFKAILLF